MTRLQPGDPAPEFSLLADDGSTRTLASYSGQRTIIYAYPAALTPGCTKQACDFRDALALFTDHGMTVVGVSPDTQAKLATFRDRYGLTFELLSDHDKTMLSAYGAWGSKQLYGKQVTGVIRSTFVISGTGTVEHAFYNVRATGHVAKLIRDLGLTSG